MVIVSYHLPRTMSGARLQLLSLFLVVASPPEIMVKCRVQLGAESGFGMFDARSVGRSRLEPAEAILFLLKRKLFIFFLAECVLL